VRGWWTEFIVLKCGHGSVARSCECFNLWLAERLSLCDDSAARRVYDCAWRLLSLRNSRPCLPTLPEWHHGMSSEATFGNEWPCADCSSQLWIAVDASVDEWCYKWGDIKIYTVHLLFVGLLSGVVAAWALAKKTCVELYRQYPILPLFLEGVNKARFHQHQCPVLMFLSHCQLTASFSKTSSFCRNGSQFPENIQL
jgi:hypothetical protein